MTFLLARHEASLNIRDFLATKLASPGERPKIVRHDVNGEAVRCLVGAGFGVSLISEAAVGTTYDGVAYREPRDGAGARHISFMAQWNRENINPALATFLKLLCERHPVLPPGGNTSPRRFRLFAVESACFDTAADAAHSEHDEIF